MDYFSFLKKSFKKERLTYIITIILKLFVILCTIVTSYTLKILIDQALPQKNTGLLIITQTLFILVTFFGNFLAIFSDNMLLKASNRTTTSLRNEIYSKILNSKINDFKKINKGEVFTKLTADIEGIAEFLVSSTASFVSSILQIIVTLIVMAVLNPLLTIITLPIIPVTILVFSIIEKRIKRISSEYINARSNLHSFIYETLDTILGIKAIGNYRYYENNFDKSLMGYQEINRRLNLNYILSSYASWLLIMVPYQAIMNGIGGYFNILKNTPSIGMLLIFANFSNSLLPAIQKIASYKKNVAYSKECYKSIEPLLKLEPEVMGDKHIASSSALSITSYGLTYVFDDSEQKIEYPNFTINKNTITTIKGESGKGKSTLLNIMFGMYPDYIGDLNINGINLKEVNLSEYRKIISYISQEPKLLHGTVFDNLNLVAADLCEQSALRILEEVGLSPDILYKNVGENGANVSLGQRQRISIAQGLLKKSKLFIFDEPNSALDEYNSKLLVNTLEKLKEEATIIISTHDNIFDDIADQNIKL